MSPPFVNSPANDALSAGGFCSSSHPWATAAGVEMLARGGNATDAAIATAFALAVCEPAMSHLGGQGNMLVHMAGEGETVGIDFYACAPGAARAGMYRWIEHPTQGDYRFLTEGDLNTTGGLSVCIPGAVWGWAYAHRRWGSIPLGTVLEPSITYARGGVPLARRMSGLVAENRDRLARYPASAAIFLRPDGSPRTEGEAVVQPELAQTLERIATSGIEEFYSGEIARAIVDCVRSDGGVLSEEDLALYPEKLFRVLPPDAVSFRGYTVQCTPPQSSALLLHLLCLLDGFDFRTCDPLSPEKLHLLIEAMKLAFAERAVHIGDHAFVNVPIGGLFNPAYAAERRRSIDPQRAQFPGPGNPWAYQAEQPDPASLTGVMPSSAGHASCTTHHSHVDRWGNFVSISQSLGDAFGSAMVVPGRGFFLNNAMKLFDPRPGTRVAAIAPYKRPLMPCPTLVLRDGAPVMALGSPSGTRIPNAIAQVLVSVLDHGTSLQAAVDAPRVHWSGYELEAESDLPDAAKAGLSRLGHEVQYRSAKSPWFGAVQVVTRDPKTGLCQGAADPRRQGAAAGLADT
ncbi:MAG: gamma-glutamyltransferase [bacterium]|nr:gamma-glutamyltransferase [bacterium]